MDVTRTTSRRRGGRLLASVAVSLLSLVAFVPTSWASTTPAQSVEPPFGAALTARMGSLFHDISLDSFASGEKLFFPEAAYVSMKTGRIPYPAADYADRLLAFFRLDLAAYHAAIFTHGPVTFLGVNANSADALWIHPGWCENSIGYWHEPNIRLVYRENHVVRSVAVASLISWHGSWYVVHLGPNPRPSNVGTVDAPSLGRGVAGPAGGC
jgi:hypothetical protein